MAAHTAAPVIGALEAVSPSEKHLLDNSTTHHFDVTVGYIFSHATTPFNGTFEEKQGARLHLQPRTTTHLTDIAVSYKLNQRWSLTANIPVYLGIRREQEGRLTFQDSGLGNLLIGAQAWLSRGPTESGGNISLGLSLKIPSGDKNNDPGIATGDGGWGFALESTGYKQTFFNSSLYYSGLYIFNPGDTNGVNLGAQTHNAPVSITDQYLYRAGVSRSVPKLRGLAASIGGRIEGIPVHNAFGGSDGFRRPGYMISVDPGLSYSRGHNSFNLNVPVAVERNFTRSTLDVVQHTHGDGAFPDFLLSISYTRHF